MAYVKLGAMAEGSIVKLNEDGQPVEFYVAKQDYEPELNGPGRVLLVRKDCYDKRMWHNSYFDAYASSDIDAWFNGDYKNKLDPAIQAAIGTTKFYYTPGNRNKTTTTLERSVFALSAGELGMFAMDLPVMYEYMPDEGTALSDTVIDLLKIVYLSGSVCPQWTRSPYLYYTYGVIGAWNLGKFGALAFMYSTNVYGSRPAFTLPATLSVSDDSEVVTNTPPTAPASITIPSQINGGSTITVEWGPASDAEDNLEGYKVERSVDGGSSWTQIYQGSAQSTTNLVPFGTQSVMYRVKACDTEGLESGWRTSAQVTVINNTAPTAPGSITVPKEVQGGQPLAVSWGASSDGENNLSGYSLERQVDGGAWAVIYSGNELSFSDTITKGWQTVAYRVRAFDEYNAYSGYAASETREVNNNTPPVITCEYPANTPLGVKNEGFEIPYSVDDEEGDEVAVTESVDGTAWRTFTAALGESNIFSLMGTDFMRVLNGRHTLDIAAHDGKAEAVHSLTFTKSVTSASVTLIEPMEADGPITMCALSVSGSIPADAEFAVEAANNALDAVPVWEDCTAAVKLGVNHIFANQTAANGFAFSFRVRVSRGESGKGGYITSVQGGFQ